MIRRLAEYNFRNVDIKTAHSAGLMVCTMNGVASYNKKASKYFYIANDLVKTKKRAEYVRLFSPAGTNTKEVIEASLKKATSQLTEVANMAMITLTDYNDSKAMAEMAVKYNIDATDPIIYTDAVTVIEQGIKSFESRTVMNFSDMIAMPIMLGLKFPKYDYVLVDEGQDLNASALQLVWNFVDPQTGIVIEFGDVNQSIQAWAGALSSGMNDFKKMANARSYPLSICYRCDLAIIRLAQILVPEIEPRDNAPEGIAAVIHNDMIPSAAQPGDYVLCRTNSPLVSMAIKMIKINKRAKVKGRDIGAALDDIYQTVVDIGAPTNIAQFIGELKDYCASEILRSTEKKMSVGKVALMKDQHECMKVIAQCVLDESISKGAIAEIYSHTWVQKKIKDLFDDNISTDYVMLSSVHKSKGLEAKRVFIIEFEKMPFTFPGKTLTNEQMQQEVNIIYVAITRAMNELYFSGVGLIDMADVEGKLRGLTKHDSSAIVPFNQTDPTINPVN